MKEIALFCLLAAVALLQAQKCPDTYTLNMDTCECQKVTDSQCLTDAPSRNTTAPCTCGTYEFAPMCYPGWNLTQSSCSCHPSPNPTCPNGAQLVGDCTCTGTSEPVCVLWGQLNTADCTCRLNIPRICPSGKATADSCQCEITQDPTCDHGLSLDKSPCGCV